MSGSIDKARYVKQQEWASKFRTFVAWSTTMLAKADELRTVSYKPEKGKGSNDPARTVRFDARHRDAIIAALRFNAYDQGLIDEAKLESYGLWDSRQITTNKGVVKPLGKMVAGRPIAESIGVAKLLGCASTSLPIWERKTKSGGSIKTIDPDADDMVKLFEQEAKIAEAKAAEEKAAEKPAEEKPAEEKPAEEKPAKGKKNGK